MRTTGNHLITLTARCLTVLGLTALAVSQGSSTARATTQNVIADPNAAWYGYENVYTNGLSATTWPAYVSQYLGSAGLGFGAAFPNNSTLDMSGNVTIGADDWPDVTSPYNTDTLIWADASGTSSAIDLTVSDIYTEITSFSGGDTVVFTGTLTTNGLATPYKNNALLFIKDYDSSWNFHGMVSLYLNTLTNGQAFALTLPSVAGNGDHVQYGLEWSGPPVRSANVANYGYATISTNGGSISAPPPPTNVYVYIDPSQAWAGYRNVTDQLGGNYGAASGYIGVGGQTPYFQGSISSQGIVTCGPDISLDTFFHTDTTIWADASGTSSPLATYDNTFYVDSTSTGARGGDTVVFSGTMITNALTDAAMSGSLVAFVKDFSSGWAYYGATTVALSDLTNGQSFTIAKTINGNGDHVQWGFEWQGTPCRTNPAAANYVGQYGYVIFSSNSVVAPGPQILSITPNNANVIVGSTVNFAANANGSGLTYRWQKNGVNLANGGGISGATAATLTLANVQAAQEGTYKLIVTDSSALSATNLVTLVVANPGWLYYDRALAPFNGYINVWNGANLISAPPASGAGGTSPRSSFGFSVAPTTQLRASFNTNTDEITLRPNTYVYDGATNTMDAAYINPDGSSAAYMEQDFYIQNDALAGSTLTFSGFCASNNLDAKYTALAWVKDGSPSWDTEHRYDAPLIPGKPFTVQVATTP
ncbi:MAG TPA: immunoglobulin domain-containing protein, partial [Verrucomicrobiae bacterium]